MTAADEVRPRLITPAFVALAAAALAFFTAGGIVLPVAPRFAKFALEADAVGVGIAIGAFSVAALLLRPLVGWSSDRFGRKPLLVGGSLLTIAALALHLVANDIVVFILARAMLGAGEGFFFVSALAAASDIAPEARRGEAISFFSLSLYLGLAFGPPIAEVLFAATDGSYQVVWLAAIAVAALAAALSILVPESAPAVRNAEGEERPRGRLFHPAGIFPGMVILLGLFGMAGFLSFLPLYTPSVGLEGAGLPLAAYALIVVGLRVIGATWPDRFGAARLSGAALALSSVGLLVIGLVPTPVGLMVGTVVFASGVAFTMPALLTLAVSRVPPEERGSVVGTTTVFLDIVFGFAPVVLGAVADATSYGATFLVSAVLAAAASALLVAGRHRVARPVAVGSG
ncbi:MAG TPA: MFS transporter [Candidatus Limnocylindrales bacterium]|nr:MFS transporter [Candidatus Limnocylindrales bacterium]